MHYYKTRMVALLCPFRSQYDASRAGVCVRLRTTKLLQSNGLESSAALGNVRPRLATCSQRELICQGGQGITGAAVCPPVRFRRWCAFGSGAGRAWGAGLLSRPVQQASPL